MSFNMRLNFTIVLLLFATATPLSVAQEQKARTTPEKLSLEECSLCADGSAPSSTNKSSSAFAIGNGITLTCEDLPTNAITLLDYGLGNSNFVCEVSQLWAYIHCGCPTPPEKRPCWICFDGDINYNQDTIVPNEALEGSCDFQAYFTGLRFDHFGRATDYAELKCPELTWGMDTWCGCPEETVSPPACTVCGNGEISSDDPCRKFWLAETLHKPSVVGPNFGTCQYYDWIVERFTKTECTTTSSNFETTGILDGLDVQSFCCNDKEPEGTIQLCQDPNATNLEHLLVPVLDVTCSDIAGQTMYLVNETVLIEPWEDLAGRSLREHCCNNHGDGLETSTTTSSTSTAIKEDTCVGLEHLRRQH